MKSIYLFIMIIFSLQVANAQNSIRPNIYVQDMQYYNPGSASVDSNYNLQTAVYGKYKSVDNDDAIWHKPMSIWLSHIGRIRQTNSFYTVSYINDSYSFFNRNAFWLGYTRQWKINKASTLSYGARLVANIDAVNWSKFTLPHNESGRRIYFNPDLDFGATYQYKKFSAGIGFKNLVANPKKLNNATLLKNHRELNLSLSYRQNISKQFTITPFILLAREPNFLIDAGLSFTVFNRINASYALRVNELKSVIVLDVNIYKGWSLGIGYDRSSLVSDNNFDFVVRYRR